MSSRSAAFTLIEVMLAVAIFAFAVVGFGVALNDVLGVNSEILRTAQRRQAIESVAAQILAVSNNLAETDWMDVPGWGSKASWVLQQKIELLRKVDLTTSNNALVSLQNLYLVELRALDAKEKAIDRIAFILTSPR